MTKKFHHHEKRVVPFSDEKLYNIVKNVEDYPAFLPWCLAATVMEHGKDAVTGNDFFVAELVVGFKSLQEKFTSRVVFDDKKKEITTYGVGGGPLASMDSHWKFRSLGPEGCEIDFAVALSFSSFITEKLFSPFFKEAVRKMSQSFFNRADSLHQ